MKRAFIQGFVDELEKNAFFGKQELRDVQKKLKKLRQDLSKGPQIEVVPAGGGEMQERPVKPGDVMASAKSMAGDVARKVKSLRPLRRRTQAPRTRKPGLVERAKSWIGRHR